MTAAELERKLTNILYEADLAEIVECLGDISGELGDTDAQTYLWNAAVWLKTRIANDNGRTKT